MELALEKLNRAKQLHRAGNLQEAEPLYRAALDADAGEAYYFLGVLYFQQSRVDAALDCFQHALAKRPNNADALNYYGMALEGKGRYDDAVLQFQKALVAEPNKLEVYNNLGIAYRKLGRIAQAIDCFQKLVAAPSPSADAHNNLGNVYKDLRDWKNAVAHYQRAIELRPKYPEAHANLAVALEESGQFDAAADSWNRVVELQSSPLNAYSHLAKIYLRQNKHADADRILKKLGAAEPNNPSVYFHLGILAGLQKKFPEAVGHYQKTVELEPKNADAWNNLGSAFFNLKKHDEAVAAYLKALELQFHHVDALFNLGTAYAQLKKWPEAELALLKAIMLRPEHFAAFNSLGIVYGNQRRFEEAVAVYRLAIKLNPKFADGWNNLGVAMNETARFAEAVDSFRKAIERHPEHADAHLNLGLTLLLLGDWKAAWPEYGWRLKTRHLPMENLNLPGAHWTGEPLNGRTILVHGEQGIGDLIQFVRYAPMIVERGGKVVVVAHPPLKAILQTAVGVSAVVVKGEQTPPYSCRTWVMNLPGIFATTPETIPGNTPYLFADPAQVAEWGKRLPPRDGKRRIGLVWGGNPANKTNHKRSIALTEFAALAKVPNLQIVSLQKGPASEQAAAPPPGLDWIDLTSQIGDFTDTAALIMNLDLVVTVDTSVAHLAGALGRPVWTLITNIPDWRWLQHGDATAWYPTMRLFRQPKPGDWTSVVEKVAAELQELRIGQNS